MVSIIAVNIKLCKLKKRTKLSKIATRKKWVYGVWCPTQPRSFFEAIPAANLWTNANNSWQLKKSKQLNKVLGRLFYDTWPENKVGLCYSSWANTGHHTWLAMIWSWARNTIIMTACTCASKTRKTCTRIIQSKIRMQNNDLLPQTSASEIKTNDKYPTPMQNGNIALYTAAWIN